MNGEMVKEKVKFERKVIQMGTSLQVNVPVELAQFLEIEKGDSVIMIADTSKHGKYIAFWKQPQTQE